MSYTCNSKCSFCYNPGRNDNINYEKIDKIVKTVARSKIPHVYLIGGEPSILKIKKLNEYIDLLSKNSSVTIVTNGLIYKKRLSKKLACIGVPIHGDKTTHEKLTGVKGGYNKVISSIKKYVKAGFDVRCIPVLMSENYNQIYNIIKLASKLKMESVFVDRFEVGGLSVKSAVKLKPSLKQFKESLTQMISGQKDFKIPVGFGTAIPFCLDERLITENMWADCGVGVTFGAINPNGDFRICNQSNIIYGNVLREPIKYIWNKKNLDDFRNLKWVIEPCSKCLFLDVCTCGCKVDLNCSEKYCVDYAIRENKKQLISLTKLKKLYKIFTLLETRKTINKFPKKFRKFKPNKYLRLNTVHKEKYLITQYQTIILDKNSLDVIKGILNGLGTEEKIIDRFKSKIEEKDLREFISNLIQVGAIDLVKD